MALLCTCVLMRSMMASLTRSVSAAGADGPPPPLAGC